MRSPSYTEKVILAHSFRGFSLQSSHCFGPVGKQHIMMTVCDEAKNHLPHSQEAKEKERP
jgi:hypothetical protein